MYVCVRGGRVRGSGGEGDEGNVICYFTRCHTRQKLYAMLCERGEAKVKRCVQCAKCPPQSDPVRILLLSELPEGQACYKGKPA